MPYKDPVKAREYNNAWTRKRQQRIRERLSVIKMESGCVDCGYRDNPDALEWDHVIPRNGGPTVGTIVGRGWAAVEREIAKCEVRCANCHAIITAERRRSVT